jgi:DNA-binding response OmpR family regulator
VFDILILTEEPKYFEELLEIFKKEFFKTNIKNLEFVDQHFSDIQNYDFIMIQLDFAEHTNKRIIKNIKSKSLCPLYIFSKNQSDTEKVKLMEFGAEGQIDIPFNGMVVASRVKAVLRFLNSLKKVKDNTIAIGPLLIDLDNYSINDNGILANLTNVEHKILKILLENRDNTVTKDDIIRFVWDDDTSATDNALGIHITRIRKKMNCGDRVEIIETIWGVGYRLNFRLCEILHIKD